MVSTTQSSHSGLLTHALYDTSYSKYCFTMLDWHQEDSKRNQERHNLEMQTCGAYNHPEHVQHSGLDLDENPAYGIHGR